MELEEFEDYRVARAVRAELGEGPLGLEQRAELEVLEVQDAKSLVDVRCFPELRELVVETSVGREGLAIDITGLSALKKLERLVIRGSVITDMAPITALESLSALELAGVGEIDIGIFESLPELVSLYLSSSQLNDLSRLVNLKKLTGLALPNVGLEEIPPLPQDLVELNLMFNHITDPSGINALSSRRVVYLNHNAISDLTSLAEGPLSYGLLDITGNPIDCELQHDNLVILVEWGALTECKL